jgi:hypothetical protein
MIRKCAWCKRVLGQKPPYNDRAVTFGMCCACYGVVLPLNEADRTWEPLRRDHRMDTEIQPEIVLSK